MNPINGRKSKSLKRIIMMAAAAFVFAVGSSPAFAQRGGGGGMGGGHAMGGGHSQGTGGGHPQGTPAAGRGGEARPHSNPNEVKGDGRGRDHHDHDHHFDHGDHGRDFDH